MSLSTQQKAMQMFRLLIKANNIMPAEIYFMSGTTGWSVPSGILVYDTTNNKLILGTGGESPETITSAA